MRVLIIGGTGQISTPMTRQLVEAGADVTVANRGRTNKPLPDGIRRISVDKRDFVAFESAMANESFDVVIDMVCYVAEEAESLVRAFAGRCEQLIFCSTVDVYQRPASRYPYLEDEPRIGISDYAKNKIVCEDLLMEAHSKGAFATTIIRPAHTYGDGHTLIHSLGWSTTFLDRLKKGKPVVVHGDGNSLWVSCHSEDVARGFIGACLNQKAFGKSYHTTGEDWLTWNQYHEVIAKAINAPAPTLVHIATDTLVKLADRAAICWPNFQYSSIYDNSAAKADLGFKQTISLSEGAKRIYDILESRGAITDSDKDTYDDQVIEHYQKYLDGIVRID